MSRYKFELFYGSSKAPVKVMSFISTTCTFCSEYMLEDLSKMKVLAKTGKVQFSFFPFLRSELDEAVFTNMIASGVNQERAYLNYAPIYLKTRPDQKNYFQMINDNAGKIGFSIKPYSQIKNADRIRSNLHFVNGIGRNAWRIKTLPNAIINGHVMSKPNGGRMVGDIAKIVKKI
ncbi:MAG: thioredoxin domain-containing protein [Pseudomonadota bacterium]